MLPKHFIRISSTVSFRYFFIFVFGFSSRDVLQALIAHLVKQARDRQFEYLNAQQGVLEDESGDELWSNLQRGHCVLRAI
jgi:hypothetical protein